MKLQLKIFLISTPDGGEWSASRHGRFALGEKSPRYSLYRRRCVLHSRYKRFGNKERPLCYESKHESE
jgi:hypothetical protein